MVTAVATAHGAETHRHHRRQLRRRQLRHVRPRLSTRASCGCGRTRASRVMGGEQAASVLATIRRDAMEARGEAWPAEEEEAFKAPIRAQYETQGHPYYATARLWDDGIIDPAGHAPRAGARPVGRAERADPADALRRVPDVSAMFAQTADRQSRRDRLPHHPHRAPPGHRAPSRSIPTPTPARCMSRMADEALPHRPGAGARELSAQSTRSSRPRGAAAPRRSIPATASCRRTPPSPRPAPRPGSSSSARRPRRSAPWAARAAAKALMERAGVPLRARLSRRRPGRRDARWRRGRAHRLSGADQGGRRRRRQGHAPRRTTPPTSPRRCAGAQREAASAFGDDRVLLENYLHAPAPHRDPGVRRHARQRASILFERDCSVQRRHQKVIEEAPAPGMTRGDARGDGRGRGRGGAGGRLCRRRHGRVHRRGRRGFYFMEMNTRLQVEHPVTETITGLDLVEWQLRVAAGEPLPRRRSADARTATPSRRGSMPRTRRATSCRRSDALAHLRLPEDGVRVDAGVRAGDAITPDYDPMIAKLIAHGAGPRGGAAPARRGAGGDRGRRRADQPRRCCAASSAHPEFVAGGVDTGFIGRNAETLLAPASAPGAEALVAAALAVLEARAAAARVPADPHSPWSETDCWRLNLRRLAARRAAPRRRGRRRCVRGRKATAGA